MSADLKRMGSAFWAEGLDPLPGAFVNAYWCGQLCERCGHERHTATPTPDAPTPDAPAPQLRGARPETDWAIGGLYPPQRRVYVFEGRQRVEIEAGSEDEARALLERASEGMVEFALEDVRELGR